MSDGHTQAQRDQRVLQIQNIAFEEMAKWPEDRLLAAHKLLFKHLGNKGGVAGQDFLDMAFLLSLCDLLPSGYVWALRLVRAHAAEKSPGAFSRMMEAEGSDLPRRMRKTAGKGGAR